MIEYKVTVVKGITMWYLNGKLHREDGPAVEYGNGSKRWYIDGKEFTEKGHSHRSQSCDGKTVEIDGQKYTLTLITE